MAPDVKSSLSYLSQEEQNLLATKTIDLVNGSVEQKREEILAYFHKTFSVYEELFGVIRDHSSYYYQPEPLRHPLIFYYGHTAVFFVNKFVLAKLLPATERIDPKLESTCAVGVDEMSWDDLNSKNYDWPSVTKVTEYRKKVRAMVDTFIRTKEFTMPIDWQSPMWMVLMGIEHERIHLETSSVLIRQMHLKDVQPLPMWRPCPQKGTAPANQLVPVSGGEVALGKPFNHALYGWDNEYGTRTATVHDFRASKFLVSNGEYLAFVQDKGYTLQEYWTEEGWRWVTYKKAQHPVFWVDNGNGGYRYRTMTEEIDMPWNWPVDVNYLEAKAFCNWMSAKTGKSIRLPMEEEYARLQQLMDDQHNQHEWKKAPGNINLEYWASSCPVDLFKQSSEPELYDIVGNVWQWNETPIHPFDGFKVHPIYDDFTTPTYDARHNLIKGGSWVSTGNEATKESRYAFRRHFFQHAGFRYIETDAPVVMPPNAEPYETDRQVCEVIHSQFSEDAASRFGSRNFYTTVADFCQRFQPGYLATGERKGKVMEIGCLGGKTCFELARHFEEVVGVDFSANLIRVGHTIQEGGRYRYTLTNEGELVTYHELSLAGLNYTKDDVDRVTLIQNDPCNLFDRLRDFDLVLVTNMTRVVDSTLMLQRIHERMRPGATLVVLSAYDWDAHRSPMEHWVGGKKVDGESLFSFDGMSHILHNNFRLVHREDLPLYVKEQSRKYRVLDMQGSVWQRS